jgi:hypothetical protein
LQSQIGLWEKKNVLYFKKTNIKIADVAQLARAADL